MKNILTSGRRISLPVAPWFQRKWGQGPFVLLGLQAAAWEDALRWRGSPSRRPRSLRWWFDLRVMCKCTSPAAPGRSVSPPLRLGRVPSPLGSPPLRRWCCSRFRNYKVEVENVIITIIIEGTCVLIIFNTIDQLSLLYHSKY